MSISGGGGKSTCAPRCGRIFRKRALAYYGFKCAVCGKDYLRRGDLLQVDHRRNRLANGDLTFGNETMADVRLRCGRCHTRGVSSDFASNEYRKSKRWERVIVWLAFAPFKLVLLIARSAFNSYKKRDE